MAYFRCGSVGGGVKSLTLSAGSNACRMAGDTTSHNWMTASIGVSLQTMRDLGFTTVTCNATKGGYGSITGALSLNIFGVSADTFPITVNLQDCTKDDISVWRTNMRGYGSQDGFQDSVSVTAVFSK